ncbi:cupin domain-containing protein [Mameliella alba]|nr:cupin domain-containing protein [Antarctobacter heliothermus]MBY6145363.1 cupin domain-containing protein [Mameliella alba]MCA0955111.1 cupin domain-containing protein [Mameliella alba]
MPIITEESVQRRSGDGAFGAHELLLFSDTGGLTQFGALVEVLAPGASYAYPHWHESEDEMIYVLEGTPTLIEGDSEELMQPGTAATFLAGVETPHKLENRADVPARVLVIGTRAPRDRVHYPAQDRVQLIERSGEEERRWTRLNGAPAEPL